MEDAKEKKVGMHIDFDEMDCGYRGSFSFKLKGWTYLLEWDGDGITTTRFATGKIEEPKQGAF